MRVSVDGDKLCVDPGVAIDGLGREIILPIRYCIDPVTQDGGCCGSPCCGESVATPPPPVDHPPGTPGVAAPVRDSAPTAALSGTLTVEIPQAIALLDRLAS